MSSTSSLEASISCPWAGQAEQEGRKRPVFLSFTTQTKQLVVREMRCSRQRVGISIPFAFATSRMVWPGSALTVRPSRINSILITWNLSSPG